jgi:hypothetical protein
MSKTEKTPKKEFHHVVRGGWWDADVMRGVMRSAILYNIDTGCRNNSLGIRLVEVLDE